MHSGKVVTIAGEVDPSELGVTLTHEHLFTASPLNSWFVQPTSEEGRAFAESEVTLENLAAIRYRPFGNKSNLQVYDVPTVIDEVAAFQRAGGGTIVDLTPEGLGRDVSKLREVQRSTGVQLITGCGYYVWHSHPERVKSMSVDDLASEILAELTHGIGDTGVSPGVIGETGTSRPLHSDEEKVLRATAQVQRQTGAPVSLHLSHPEDYGHTVLDILEEAGANLSKVVIGHQDGISPFDIDYHASIAARGAYVEYDLFGCSEFSEDGLWAPPPADIERINALSAMCALGWESRVLVSHDVCSKVQLLRYGGFGYAHLPGHVRRVMEIRGFSVEQVNTIMITNPATWLTWDEPA